MGDCPWVLVPREPTEGMLGAGMAEAAVDLASEYRAMLASAPSPMEDEALVKELAIIIVTALVEEVPDIGQLKGLHRFDQDAARAIIAALGR